MKTGKIETRKDRIGIVNEIIKEISDRSRRFFYSEKSGNVSKIIEKNNRLYYVDHYTGNEIYLHAPKHKRWNGFSNGGTMRGLVLDFKEFIMSGDYSNHNNGYGGLYCTNWGYKEEDMKAIQEKAIALGYLLPKEVDILRHKL
jgi:hypothetical protein